MKIKLELHLETQDDDLVGAAKEYLIQYYGAYEEASDLDVIEEALLSKMLDNDITSEVELSGANIKITSCFIEELQ